MLAVISRRFFSVVLLVAMFASRANIGLATDAPMNLLIISTDEHHFSTLGCYGGKSVETPNIDWIANNGALSTSFYATTPVCSPSRASLVSGLYPQKTPVTTNNIPLDDSVITFAEILRRRGYATGYAGKWHLDGGGKPAHKEKSRWMTERLLAYGKANDDEYLSSPRILSWVDQVQGSK